MATHNKPTRQRTTVRLVGTPKRKRVGQPIDTQFRHGTVRAALTVSSADRTLGKGSYRFTATAAERKLHSAVNAKRNTAEWVANQDPMAYVTATRRDAIGTEGMPDKASIRPVAFEWRIDHLARGRRSNNW